MKSKTEIQDAIEKYDQMESDAYKDLDMTTANLAKHRREALEWVLNT